MTETTALDVVAEAPVKKKEVERGNKVLVTPLYGVKGANDARSATANGTIGLESRRASRRGGVDARVWERFFPFGLVLTGEL